MPRRSTLNGIPHNFTQSFFGTERYYHCGYMGDWVLKAAKRLNLKTASLDVLHATFEPAQLNLYPLITHAKTLKKIIETELTNNGFEIDFIKEAAINFQFPDPTFYRKIFYCFPYLVDKDGKRYEPGRIIADALEDDFDPFDYKNLSPSKKEAAFFDKMFKFFRN